MTQECLLLCHVTCNMSQLSCVMGPAHCATSAIKHNWSARTRRYSTTSCATIYTSCVAAVLCTGDTEECTVTVSRHRHPGTLATWTVRCWFEVVYQAFRYNHGYKHGDLPWGDLPCCLRETKAGLPSILSGKECWVVKFHHIIKQLTWHRFQ